MVRVVSEEHRSFSTCSIQNNATTPKCELRVFWNQAKNWWKAQKGKKLQTFCSFSTTAMEFRFEILTRYSSLLLTLEINFGIEFYRIQPQKSFRYLRQGFSLLFSFHFFHALFIFSFDVLHFYFSTIKNLRTEVICQPTYALQLFSLFPQNRGYRISLPTRWLAERRRKHHFTATSCALKKAKKESTNDATLPVQHIFICRSSECRFLEYFWTHSKFKFFSPCIIMFVGHANYYFRI